MRNGVLKIRKWNKYNNYRCILVITKFRKLNNKTLKIMIEEEYRAEYKQSRFRSVFLYITQITKKL